MNSDQPIPFERFKNLVDALTGVAVHGFRVDGVVTYWNESAERLYGYTSAEAIGQNRLDLIVPATMRDETWSRIQSAVAAKIPVPDEEHSLKRKNGSSVPVQSSHVIIYDADGCAELFCIDVDISERKKLEQQFLRAQRMESIGTLAGGIAHDLNNVLMPILLGVDLLKVDPDNKEDIELLESMRHSARRGAEMVAQILSFARGMDGKRTLVPMQSLIRDLEKIVTETLPKHIRLRSDCPVDVWTVKGDPTQIHQVLLNLFVNARDAMPTGGQLVLRASNVHLDDQYLAMGAERIAAGSYLRLDVEDTGHGIPSDILDKIFDPFFTTKDPGKGTGLGLATSRAIVKGHGGFMDVQSRVGEGTRFSVYLPAAPEGSAPDDEPLSTLPRGSGETILVVDDESSVRQITRQTLEAFGYRVALASDGAEAVSMFGNPNANIDLVVTDMSMPVMDGMATIKVMKRLNAAIPIIAVSGFTHYMREGDALEDGMVRFLSKPYTAETLLTSIREVLDSKLT